MMKVVAAVVVVGVLVDHTVAVVTSTGKRKEM